MADLKRSIKANQEAIQLASPDAEKLSAFYNNLGISLHTSYEQSGDIADLDRGIEALQQAGQLRTDPAYLSNLGVSLSERYALTGRLTDLEQAIDVHHQAVKLTPTGSPDLPEYLNNLANILHDRYARTGSLADLTKAIDYYRQAVQLCPKDAPRLPGYLNNLGISLRHRYQRLGWNDFSDLDEAIKIHQQAVQLTPINSPNLPMYLNSLGTILRDRYIQLENPLDLEQAIEAFQRAVSLSSPTYFQRSIYLHALGLSLRDHYKQTDDHSDLQCSIETLNQAIHSLIPTSPYRGAYLNSLAVSLSDNYAYTNSVEDFNAAKQAYQESCQIGVEQDWAIAVKASKNWGDWAMQRKAWNEAQEAYDYGVKVVDKLLGEQLERSGKESWLSETQELYAHVAYAYTHNGELSQAVTTLEHGRAFLLSETLERERTDLVRLPTLGYTDLYQEYIRYQDQLFVLENRAQIDFDHLRKVRAELNEVIAQIQQISGYEDFFHLPMFEDDIVGAIRGSL